MTAAMIPQRYVGRSVERSEDRRILTGTGTYVDDIKLPGMLHAVFVRSPFAHARITGVEVEEARTLPGVHAVITSDDLQPMLDPDAGSPGGFGRAPYHFTVLADDKVRVVGDPVVLIVAESRYIAEDAAELVVVDYDPLPAVPDIATALDPSSAPIFEDLGHNRAAEPRVNTYGDVDEVFGRADRIVSATIHQHRHQNVPMECRGCVSEWDEESGRLIHHAANQGVASAQNTLATQLGLDRAQVRVVCKDIGGSFGLKNGAAREEIATAAASRHLKRPVKWIEDRNVNLSYSGHAREEYLEVEAAVGADAEILGLKVRMFCDTGAYPALGGFLGNIVQRLMPGPYRMQALQFEYIPAITNKATYVAYRGPWAAETFTRERVIDRIADELGMDRLELRLRNLDSQIENPGRMITGASLRSCTVREAFETIRDTVDLAEFRERQAAARAEGRHIGIGFAGYIEGPGPRGESPLGRERLRAELAEDGTLLVYTGQMPHGQSHETAFAQIAADEFGVEFDQVRVVAGDSDVVPAGGTGGSRGAAMGGGATIQATRELRAKVLALASHVIEASPEDLEIADGGVRVKGVPASSRSLAEIAAAARSGDLPEGVDVELVGSAEYDGGNGGWSGGGHCAIVEVDVETGLVNIERYLAVEDCGQMINPALVEGQVCGGIVQGIGAVLLERSAYDEDANYLSGSFMDYLLPSTTEVPHIEIVHMESVLLDEDNNIRGVGEGGMIVCPPTLVSAIEDALSPFGVTISEQHLPPQRILELIGSI